jgi:hypothetical protein
MLKERCILSTNEFGNKYVGVTEVRPRGSSDVRSRKRVRE